MSKIGILLNEKQEMASLADGSNVVIYAKKDGKWVPTEEIVECFKKYDARTQMRALMAELIQEMT